jgi:hypothetical protein
MAVKNDEKYYLNILETLSNGKYRHWLTFGFARGNRDFYLFDPRTSREVHISHHNGGNVHIKHGDWDKKLPVFKNKWIDNPTPGFLKQVIYFRPEGSESYPILETPPITPKTENICFNFSFGPDCIIGPFPNIVFKILLGPSTTEPLKYSSFHYNEGNNNFDQIIHNEFWSLAVTTILLAERPETDKGTFIWLFNTTVDIDDNSLFGAPIVPKPELSRPPFLISHANFPEGEVAIIYYEIKP